MEELQDFSALVLDERGNQACFFLMTDVPSSKMYNTFEHPVLLFGHTGSLLSKEFCKVVVVLFLDRVGRVYCVGSFRGAAQFVSP